jgi:YidC/Oxa1 family membrane protein insertase
MFDSLIHFFFLVLYQPLFNALVLLYDYIPGHDFGVAIIFLTLIIRIILYPISLVAVKSQRGLQKLQPKIQEIQKKHKNDREKQAKETLELYKTEKINPFSGLLLSIIQIPILIALYRVFWNGLNPNELGNLYSFVLNPGQLNPFFLGLLDLSKANIMIAILAGVTQYFQTKMLLPKISSGEKKQGKEADFSQIMQKQTTYFLPIFTVIILLGLPSALGFYWIASAIFSIIQQYFIFKKDKNTEPVRV